MDKKQALELVNQMIEEQKRTDVKSALNDFVTEFRARHFAPLTKAIKDVEEELRKVDPNTKLPGTLLDKGGQHNEMGAMQGNLNPGAGADMSNGIIKADPATAAPMLGSEGKKHDWKGFMQKCMKTLTASQKPEALGKPYASDAQRKKFHAMENRGEISHATVKEWDQASKGKKLPEHVKKDASQAPALGGTGTGAPSTPVARPNKGFGAIVVKQEMKKDDKPHPAGSPEERSHAVAEGMVGLPVAAKQMNAKGHEAVHKFFNHLRTLKDKGKMRSPENVMTQKSEEKLENQKDMSQDAKSAIMESADKPMKVQENRPGQANKPS